MKNSDGTGEEEFISKLDNRYATVPLSSSPDGQYLLVNIYNESRKMELGFIDLSNEQRPNPIKKLNINGIWAGFSPDRNWFVYESPDREIFVSSFRDNTSKWQLTSNGGTNPIWIKDRILYYSPSTTHYESIQVNFKSGKPVFDLPKPILRGSSQNIFITGQSRDSKQYLILRPGNSESEENLSLIVNWKTLVEQKEMQ